MSSCISRHGEYSEHTLNDLYVCTYCSALDEDAMIAEVERLKAAAHLPGWESPAALLDAYKHLLANHEAYQADIGRRVAADRAVIDAAKALREAQPEQASMVVAPHILDAVMAVCAAAAAHNALEATVSGQSDTRQEEPAP